MAGELKPRLCLMTKGDNGYGFHLHGEKGKSGQYIRKVEPDSPAEASGLRAGDRVVEVNGENVERETHHQVVQRIKAVSGETSLLVVDRETNEYLRSLRLPCSATMATEPAATGHASSSASASSPPPTPSKRHATSDPPKPSRRSPSRAHKKEVASAASLVASGGSGGDAGELAPRLCHLVRAETGYGFNLHSERSRPGQYIRSLDPASPADRAGLRPQDRLIEVNGVNIEGMRHAEVVAFIKGGGGETRLLVVDPDTDTHFRRMGITPSSQHLRDSEGQSFSNGSPSPRINGSSSASHSTHSDISSTDASTLMSEGSAGGGSVLDPFAELGLRLSVTAAEAREKAHAKRNKRRAPNMDWSRKYEMFSNF